MAPRSSTYHEIDENYFLDSLLTVRIDLMNIHIKSELSTCHINCMRYAYSNGVRDHSDFPFYSSEF